MKLRTGVDTLLSDVGGLLADLLDAPQGEGDGAESHSRRVLDAEMHAFWKRFYHLKERHANNQLSVAVLALTKSGAWLAGRACNLPSAALLAANVVAPPSAERRPHRSDARTGRGTSRVQQLHACLSRRPMRTHLEGNRLLLVLRSVRLDIYRRGPLWQPVTNPAKQPPAWGLAAGCLAGSVTGCLPLRPRAAACVRAPLESCAGEGQHVHCLEACRGDGNGQYVSLQQDPR